MIRDMDVVRSIALTVAASAEPVVREVAGIEQAVFASHVQWMEEAGLVHAALSPKDSMRPASSAIVYRLTWAGCDFADAVRSDTLWAKAKRVVLKPAGSWTFGVLVDWLKDQISEGLTGISN